ncbi:hypothetical protein C4580_01645 [Candidatus Woesearchaeota archaeon]|nr:MAG: hypothetical protein C4580_01645 [Candidatus Woesearchaeota archaeon]
MSEEFFRVIAGTQGIYAAVERDCPRNDARRKNKPDGSWLPKEGPKHPGAISFWKEFGLQKYIASGLLGWHAFVVKEPIQVQIISRPPKILHEDDYQIICIPADVQILREEPLEQFLAHRTVPE